MNENDRILEKVRKARKALNTASGLVVPILTFSSELWVLNDNDVILLINRRISKVRRKERRVQRFSQCSPNETSYSDLGWIRLEVYIYVKKILFIRSISALNDESIYKQLFQKRLVQYNEDKPSAEKNLFHSPIFDMIRIAEMF